MAIARRAKSRQTRAESNRATTLEAPMGGHAQMLKIRRTKKRNKKVLASTMKLQKKQAKKEATAAKQKAGA